MNPEFIFPEFVKSIDTIAWCMFGGVIIGAGISVYFKEVLGAFVRFLIKNGYNSIENAPRLEETKFAKNFFVKRAIRKGTYKRVMKTEAPDDDKLTEKELILKTKYYIPEDLVFQAENVFSKKGTNWFALILTVLLFFIVAALSLFVVPDLIQMLNNFINGL
ncbi:MAG: hypothetical protein IKL21_07975 [Clostridia bacterium]|jgi:hypothetical protein|nr:hypothetical protein [Clostridia bacterium]